MVDFGRIANSRAGRAASVAVLIALGAAGGAGAVQATRPAIEMAPTVQTPIVRLPATSGVVTVKGRVAEVYGDRFVMQDASGRAMIAAGREARGTVRVGQPLMVQGRYDDGQLRASYLVDGNGAVAAVGPRGPRPGSPGGPGRDGPPPPPGCAAGPGVPGGPGFAPPPPPPPRSSDRTMPDAPPGALRTVPAGQAPSATAPTAPRS